MSSLCFRFWEVVAYKSIDHIKYSIGQWCSNNLLLFNPSKTKLIVFGSRQMHSRLVTPRLTFMGRDLVPEHTAKDLGVTLDTNLTYDKPITKTVSSCMFCLSQISCTKHVFDNHILLTIINALVFSKLFYCLNIWANTSKCNMSKLQSIENFAAWIVTRGRKDDCVTPVLNEIKWLPVATQLYLRYTVMAFKCLAFKAMLCSRVPFLSIHKVRRNKQAHHKRFTDTEYSVFQDC